MYTLHKAKEEIDAVAKHATDIASHVLTLSDDVRAELQSFRNDILEVIDKKFADLERAIQGESAIAESSAVADLGAKVSMLAAGKASQASRDGSEPDTRHSGDEHQPEHGSGQQPVADRIPNGDPQAGDHHY